MATHSSTLAWRIPGTWWAAIYGVAQNWTRLKRVGSDSSSIQDLPETQKSHVPVAECSGQE